MKHREGLYWWSMSISRETSDPYWRYPKVQGWRSKETRGAHLRVGWRRTAWGIHVDKRHLANETVVNLARQTNPDTGSPGGEIPIERILQHADETWRERIAALEALKAESALIDATKFGDYQACKETFKKAHQDWMEVMMAFWPRIRTELGEGATR
jgi:hypothetical protein